MCVSTNIAKIVKEIKLTIKSDLFKNVWSFIYNSIQQTNKLKYIGRLPEFMQEKQIVLFFFFQSTKSLLTQSFSFDELQ